MKQVLYFSMPLLCLLLSGCQDSPGQEAEQDIATQNLFSLDVDSLNYNQDYTYESPSGKEYIFSILENENWESEIDIDSLNIENELLSASTNKSTSSSLDCVTDFFHGKARGVVKTSVVEAPYENFKYLISFMNSLPSPGYMRNDSELHGNTYLNTRVEEENRNVTIKTCYIYFMKREPDNDFHIILGSHPTLAKSKFFNVENSGLPNVQNPYYKSLKVARAQLENEFGEFCHGRYYSFAKNPIKIEISGSLYYDIVHGDGAVGPKGYRPATAWEIHPITSIRFY